MRRVSARKSRKSSRPSSSAPRRRRKLIVDILLSLLLGVLVGLVVVYLLLGHQPDHFVDQPAADTAAVRRHYRQFTDKMLRMVEGLNRDGRATGRFTEEELTAVLQTVEHPELARGTSVRIGWLKLPDSVAEDIGALQVHITPEDVQLACRYRRGWLNSPVMVLRVVPKLEAGVLVPEATLTAGALSINPRHYRPLLNRLRRQWLGFNESGNTTVESVELAEGHLELTLTRTE